MMLVRGRWTEHWLNSKVFYDECSKIRHFFAKLGLCKHKGEWLSMKQHFHKVYKELDKEYESIFGEKRNG